MAYARKTLGKKETFLKPRKKSILVVKFHKSTYDSTQYHESAIRLTKKLYLHTRFFYFILVHSLGTETFESTFNCKHRVYNIVHITRIVYR